MNGAINPAMYANVSRVFMEITTELGESRRRGNFVVPSSAV